MKRRRSGMGGPARSRGFSLIEVLIALLVLQVTLGILNVKLALPLEVAVAHNGVAVALLFVLVSLLARLRAPD